MNLQKLFQAQAKLNKRIVEVKGLEGQDLLAEDIRALLTELGELSNEERSFKYWSKDQESNIEQWVECTVCDGTGDLNYETVQEDAEGTGGHEYIDCEKCDSSGTTHMINPLLEEYANCLSFILKIGNDLELNDRPNSLVMDIENEPVEISVLFIEVTSHVSELFWSIYQGDDDEMVEWRYKSILTNFIHLGKELGFTREEVESTYFKKRKINYERQTNGY